jgi:hypothetical protein
MDDESKEECIIQLDAAIKKIRCFSAALDPEKSSLYECVIILERLKKKIVSRDDL